MVLAMAWRRMLSSRPDPSAMMKEINGLGMQVMVTVWPFTHNGSLSYDKMASEGWLTKNLNASEPIPATCPAGNICPAGLVTNPDGLHGNLVDVTNPAAMEYVWSMLEDGCVRAF
jgi:alpha-glucosidase (family GH31 glycosyl hydrolase)